MFYFPILTFICRTNDTNGTKQNTRKPLLFLFFEYKVSACAKILFDNVINYVLEARIF